ncbi:hypothetical protein F5B19DRAFT_175471 [Rostrohypoxylon terebratum]|nr:hypothetical protein F5B19DRAFT_175471 [Rostrohypoxylon terebratum]
MFDAIKMELDVSPGTEVDITSVAASMCLLSLQDSSPKKPMNLDGPGTDLATAFEAIHMDNHKKARQNKPRINHLSHPLGPREPKRCGRKLDLPRRQAKITSLTRQFVRYDPFNFFLHHYESVLFEWIALIQKTTLPTTIPSWDPSILAAFRALDDVITGKRRVYLLSRLAHVRLLQVFDTLEIIIASESRLDLGWPKPGSTYMSRAIDMYQDAQEMQLDPRSLRRRVHERRRSCRRWEFLQGPSPFFLLIYSDMAEKTVKGFSEVDDNAIKILASNLQKEIPAPLVRACIFLAGVAQRVANSGYPIPENEIKQLRGYVEEMMYTSASSSVFFIFVYST